MKIAKILAQQITTNPKLKSNPIDQFIQKKNRESNSDFE